MVHNKELLPNPETDPAKWTPAEKAQMKKLAKTALRLWNIVLFGGADIPLRSLFKKNTDIS